MIYLDTPRPARGARAVSAKEKMQVRPLIAIRHLQWDWEWQRLQQFLSRLAQSHPMLFVETHRTETPANFTRTRIARNHPRVTIIEIHLPLVCKPSMTERCPSTLAVPAATLCAITPLAPARSSVPSANPFC